MPFNFYIEKLFSRKKPTLLHQFIKTNFVQGKVQKCSSSQFFVAKKYVKEKEQENSA